MILYCNLSEDFNIVDGKGNKLTIDEARQIVESGKMTDCNLGLQRLITYDWNVQMLKQFYIDHP